MGRRGLILLLPAWLLGACHLMLPFGGPRDGEGGPSRNDAGRFDATVPEPTVFAPVPLPPGGEVLSITASASHTMYVSTAGGRVFRSTTRGTAWSECGAPHDLVNEVSAAPDSDRVLAATTKGVLLSTDGCASWQATNLGSGAGLGSGARHLVALANSTALASTSTELWRLQDGSWKRLVTSFDGHEVSVLLAGPTQVFAGTRDSGLARSLDGGTTWMRVTGLTSTEVHDLALDARNPWRLFVATQAGVFRSLDGGDTWTEQSDVASYAVAVNPSNPDHVMAEQCTGLHLSTDGGDSFDWVERRSDNMVLARVKKFLVDGTRLYAATPRGVFVADGWDSIGWSELNNGINAWTIRAAAVSAADGLTLLSTSSAVLRSTDGGAPWTVVWDGLKEATQSQTWDLLLDPENRNRVLVAGEGLFESKNGGTSFNIIYPAILEDAWACTAIALAGKKIYSGTRRRLLVSSDGGVQWTPRRIDGSDRSDRDVRDLLLDPAGTTTTLLVASASGVFYTRNDGETFTGYHQGRIDLDVYALALAPGGGYLAGTAKGVFRSDGLDREWALIGLGNTRVRALLVDGNRVVAATDAGVFLSPDRGRTWKELAGLSSSWPESLTLAPGGRLLVGTEGHGLHRTVLP